MASGPFPAQSPPARLHFVLAARARVGVIFRRGPTDWTRLVRWNTATDECEAGQWLHGQVFGRRADLSPDGELLVYFAAKRDGLHRASDRRLAEELLERQQRRDPSLRKVSREYGWSWTAVSRPPWFTALALWPKGDSYGGGGVFTGDRDLQLNHHECWARPHEQHRPERLQVTLTGIPTVESTAGIWRRRMTLRGWRMRSRIEASFASSRGYTTTVPEEWTRPCPARADLVLRLRGHSRGWTHDIEEFALLRGDEELPLPGVIQADWDQRGRLVFVRDGAVFMAALEGETLHETCLLDLNGQRPSEIPPPEEATRW